MSKVRIYELAKETGLSNKDVIRRLSELGVDAKSHSSTVEDDDAKRFRDSLGRLRAARRRTEEERSRREADSYDLDAIKAPPAQTTARRILPPHLRAAQRMGANPPVRRQPVAPPGSVPEQAPPGPGGQGVGGSSPGGQGVGGSPFSEQEQESGGSSPGGQESGGSPFSEQEPVAPPGSVPEQAPHGEGGQGVGG
ncbi:MAG: translation initiation factor IF-2 N-terminal domain-containing protein, partial [Egibacteraceae bacterium]